MTKIKNIPDHIQSAEEFIEWIVPQLGEYTPKKATKVIKFLCQFFRCKEHTKINCPECSKRILESQETIDKEYNALKNRIMEKKHEELSDKIKQKIERMKGKYE